MVQGRGAPCGPTSQGQVHGPAAWKPEGAACMSMSSLSGDRAATKLASASASSGSFTACFTRAATRGASASSRISAYGLASKTMSSALLCSRSSGRPSTRPPVSSDSTANSSVLCLPSCNTCQQWLERKAARAVHMSTQLARPHHPAAHLAAAYHARPRRWLTCTSVLR